MLNDDIDPVTARQINTWLREYIALPHAELGRRGPVCPFVLPALKQDAVALCCASWRPDDGATYLQHIARSALDKYIDLRPTITNGELFALVVVLPAMPREQWCLIDAVHPRMKNLAVAKGLMIGQFHPECPTPAAHNPSFPVNRAPMPLLVVRQMAVHDILFLADKPEWLHAYQQRFPAAYRSAADAPP
ncbi:DUF6875 domain-containing protein [Nocardia sp. NRRL WC-3656]|uniref:DUF6875 domain-containing protein n=1 Tax=Nocardia sp. NRRL WC-3656 TaxID=1463824 RepID=UPI0012DCC7E3|nr:hypothetical protein [Nocardia sp. NRRL WC-3656]